MLGIRKKAVSFFLEMEVVLASRNLPAIRLCEMFGGIENRSDME